MNTDIFYQEVARQVQAAASFCSCLMSRCFLRSTMRCGVGYAEQPLKRTMSFCFFSRKFAMFLDSSSTVRSRMALLSRPFCLSLISTYWKHRQLIGVSTSTTSTSSPYSTSYLPQLMASKHLFLDFATAVTIVSRTPLLSTQSTDPVCLQFGGRHGMLRRGQRRSRFSGTHFHELSNDNRLLSVVL